METGFKYSPVSAKAKRDFYSNVAFAILTGISIVLVGIVSIKHELDVGCLGPGKGEELAVCRAFYDYSEYFHGYR